MVSNFFCTLLVIAIHYNSKRDISLQDGLSINYFVQDFFANGIARSAVPFFALMSGFFFFLKYSGISDYKVNVGKRVNSILIPYLVASLLIFSSYVVAQIFLFKEGYDFAPSNILRDVIGHPRSMQFWYLRDLMILVVISPLLMVHSRFAPVLGLILLGAWMSETQVFPLWDGWYLINIETLFFFWLGGFLVQYHVQLNEFIDKNKALVLVFLPVWLGLLAVRVCYDPGFDLWYQHKYDLMALVMQKTAILTGLASIFLLSVRITHERVLWLSGFTFFVFLFHAVPLTFILEKGSTFLINKEYGFYLRFPLAVLISFGMAIFCNKYLSGFYSLVTGGRNPGGRK